MTFIPNHSLTWINAGWFCLFYGLLSLSIMAFLPVELRKRILNFPKFKNKTEKIFSWLSLFFFARGLILYSLFIPLRLSTTNFYIGTVIYLIGLISSIGAMIIFSRAELSRPVTSGIYKISRHPMQVMSLFMWIGISIAAGTWILIILAVVMGLISYPFLCAQERFCIEKYGNEYCEYMERTPRYLFF